MPRIKDSSIDELRNRVNIYDLVSLYVSLKKSGSSYRGLSPFSSEKTPSFFVYPDKGFYYCFSTSQGGDIFKFVQVKEGMTFPEAAEFIANRFSIPLEYDNARGNFSKGAQSLKKQIFDLNEDACGWFHLVFKSKSKFGGAMREYWTVERGFSLETAGELRIGAAPVDWAEFKSSIDGKYSPGAVLESGLFFAPKNAPFNLKTLMPRFRGRLMIPICDVQGRVIAFTARKTPMTPSDIPYEEGKYVNSPETPVFKKQNMLFNFNRAKKPAAELGYFILVEGQLDAIRMYSSGFKNTVAGQGTGLGEAQFSLMARHAKKICIMLDGDSAGLHAADRVLPLCLKADLEPFVAVLPEGEDPDSLLKSGGAPAMEKILSWRKNAVKFICDNFKKSTPNPSLSDKRETLNKIYALVLSANSNLAKDEYLRLAASELGADYSAIAADYLKIAKDASFARAPSQTENAENSQKREGSVLTNAVYDILSIILKNPALSEAVSGLIDTEWLDGNTPEENLLRRVIEFKREGDELNIAEIEDETERNIAYKILADAAGEPEDAPAAAAKCVEKIHKNHCERRMLSLSKALKSPDQSAEQKRAALSELASIRKILREIKFIIK